MYSVISCYFIDFIPALQIILFVRGSKNRVKSVRVYEVAPRFCTRLFIMDKNRYPADEGAFAEVIIFIVEGESGLEYH